MTPLPALRAREAVPLRERLPVMQYVRAAAISLVLLGALLLPESLGSGRDDLVRVTLLYTPVVLAAGLLGRRLRRVAALFSGMLIVDGCWLAWGAYLTGGVDSPVLYVTLLHVAAVALLASYRSGLKLALWHSLLLVLVHNAMDRGVLTRTTAGGPDAASGGLVDQRLAVFVVVLWLVAIATSALSAVNERELRRQRFDLEAQTRLTDRLEAAGDPASVAHALLDTVLDSLGERRRPPRAVVLGGPEGQLGVLASAGLPDVAARPGRPGPSAVVDRAQRDRRAVLVSGLDPDADPWLTHLLPGARDLVVVPLAADGRRLGVVVLEQPAVRRGPARVARREIAALERFANYTSLALRSTWLLEQLRRLAATDGLTKIANRRTFESTLEREIARAARSGEQVSLVMIDIDHFKRLNDEQGHQAGDEVLRNVAAALSCECRDFDTPARYGGEEFAVVLPGCGPAEAGPIAERLRLAVAQAPSAVPVTASAGVASYPSHGQDADMLIRAADEALYDSKEGGRDRITLSTGLRGGRDADALLRRAVAARIAAPRGLSGSLSAAPEGSSVAD